MIIKYPTGLYASVLPKNPQDAGNVTYTISDTAPPRGANQSTLLPLGVMLQRRGALTYTATQRRLAVGLLAYSMSSGGQTITSSTTKMFEAGQVLEFDDVAAVTVDPMLVAQDTSIRHDTNTLDYGALGLGTDDISTITSGASAALASLQDQLTALKQQRADAEATIATLQTQINEATKTIAAVQVLAGLEADVAPILAKLQATLAGLEAAQVAEIESANGYAAQASAVLDQITSVAQLVR